MSWTKPGAMPELAPEQLAAIERAAEQERAAFARRLQRDDEDRARAGRTKLYVVSGFTIFGEPDYPEGRVVNRGEEIEVSDFDLPHYLGKAKPIDPG